MTDTVEVYTEDGIAAETSRQLTAAEQDRVTQLRSKILRFAKKNEKKFALYEGSFHADQIGIAVPPFMKDWPVRIGWGTTVVDVIAERMNWIKFVSEAGDDGLMGLDGLAKATGLAAKIDRALLASLVTGIGFLVVTPAADGGVSVESRSPSTIAIEEDHITGTLSAALIQVRGEGGQVIAETLYTPDEVVLMLFEHGRLAKVERDANTFGEVPVVPMPNQPTDLHPRGRSLLTPSIEYAIGAAARTILGMEVHREFYGAPQRVALGVEPEVLGFDEDMSAAEKRQLGWSIAMGTMNIVPPQNNGDGQAPTMHEFRGSAPSGYIEMLRHLSLMVCSDGGVPPSYLGVFSDNPSSADAIKRQELRIEHTSDERIRDHDEALLRVARLMLLARDGSVDTALLLQLRSKWRPTTAPTPSAAADAGMKLVSAQILPPDSQVTWDRIGLSEDEQKILKQEVRVRRGMQAILNQIRLGDAAGEPPPRTSGRVRPPAPGDDPDDAGLEPEL